MKEQWVNHWSKPVSVCLQQKPVSVCLQQKPVPVCLQQKPVLKLLKRSNSAPLVNVGQAISMIDIWEIVFHCIGTFARPLPCLTYLMDLSTYCIMNVFIRYLCLLLFAKSDDNFLWIIYPKHWLTFMNIKTCE